MECDRKILRFSEIAKELFAFLNNEYNFKIINDDDNYICYKSKLVYVRIYHERMSFEIYYSVGLIDEKNFTVSNMELVEYEGKTSKCFMASNEKSVRYVLQKLSSELHNYGEDALSGNREYYLCITKMRDENQCKLILEDKLNYINANANEAWNNKNYKLVVDTYYPYLKYLTSTQVSKYNYALKKIHN